MDINQSCPPGSIGQGAVANMPNTTGIKIARKIGAVPAWQEIRCPMIDADKRNRDRSPVANVLASVICLIFVGMSPTSLSADLKVLAGSAVQPVLTKLLPEFEATSGPGSFSTMGQSAKWLTALSAGKPPTSWSPLGNKSNRWNGWAR